MLGITREDWIQRAAKLGAVCSEFAFRVSKGASEKQADWRQRQINRPIPSGIREFACDVASRFELKWELTAEATEHALFREEFPTSGGFEFNFFEIDLGELEGWEHSFSHWQDYRQEPNPFDVDELFPVFGVANGDLIVELIGARERGAIYYLDHESGSGDWKRLAASYSEFLGTLAALWFPSLDWHDSLEKFHDPGANRLSSDSPLATQWRAFVTEITRAQSIALKVA